MYDAHSIKWGRCFTGIYPFILGIVMVKPPYSQTLQKRERTTNFVSENQPRTGAEMPRRLQIRHQTMECAVTGRPKLFT